MREATRESGSVKSYRTVILVEPWSTYLSGRCQPSHQIYNLYSNKTFYDLSTMFHISRFKKTVKCCSCNLGGLFLLLLSLT